jgi:hypothetical protein
MDPGHGGRRWPRTVGPLGVMVGQEAAAGCNAGFGHRGHLGKMGL